MSIKTQNPPIHKDLLKSVIKRDGTIANFDIEKVKKVIAWATQGLEINPLKLEASIDIIFHDKIKTTQIQENLIYHALSLTSVKEPDWRIVAGRLLTMNMWKDTQRNRGYLYEDYLKHIQSMVKQKKYDPKILKLYSKVELEEAGSWIDNRKDLDYDYAGIVLLSTRYLIQDELPQEAYLTIALLLASVEEKNERLIFAKKFYNLIASRKISLATPILLNLRRPSGNLSSCFIIAIDDDINSIFDTVTKIAKISKNGGGVGINLSKIRAKGSWVKKHPNASGGVIPWIKIINDTAVAVNQMGKRAGAVTVSLDVWHLDFEEFLELQTENGDQRRKAYDIFPQVVIPDLFMNCVKENKDFFLFDPYEVKTKLKIDLAECYSKKFEESYQKCILAYQDNKLKLVKKVSSKELFKQIMKTQLETGMPYIFFKDTANSVNPNSHEGYIPFRILDNAIDLTTTPDQQSSFHNNKYRTIGLGAMGLADYLAKNNLKYEQAQKEVGILFENIAFYSIDSSIELSKKRGPFKAFKNSKWDNKERINNFATFSQNPKKWLELQDKIDKHGIRNSQILAIAPNTSSALVQGCTPSVLPIFSKFYMDKNSKGSVPVCPPFIKDRFWYYKEYKHMDSKAINAVIGEIQKWIDTGISYELIFNLNLPHINAKYIFETLLDAWEKKIKTIYYIRTIQKDGSSLDKEECISCSS
ncbi:MAG: ribonucleoside-diphosphate reductase subunit alpha [Chlamydiae bacterium]|nr:ribonucleoside-diphosphate reductase subunit alpha [Chlamydiota bacterium]